MAPSVDRHPTYYLPTKIFLVDGAHFQIHVDFLARESQVFKDMMNLPVSPDGSGEGMSDENPICLQGVSKDAFVQLLRVLYPPTKIGCPDVLSFRQWNLVLELADRYCMDSLRKHAIDKMQNVYEVDAVDKLAVARKFHIFSWLQPAFIEILQRSKPLDQYALDLLGADTVFRLVAIRDRMPWKPRALGKLQDRPSITYVSLTEIIHEQFPEVPEISSANTGGIGQGMWLLDE